MASNEDAAGSHAPPGVSPVLTAPPVVDATPAQDTTTTAPEPAAADIPPEVASLVAALKTLYGTKDTKEQDGVLSEHYSTKIQFTDNILHVSGLPNMKVQFHGIAKMFKYATFEAASATVEQGEGGKRTVAIQNKQEYALGSKPIKLDVVTKLDLDAAGKVVRHVDVWQGAWSNYGVFKRLIGSSTSVIFRLIRL